MAKLPSRESLGPLPQTGRGGTIARIQPSVPDVAVRSSAALARGTADLGRGIAIAGQALADHARKQDEFEAERKFQEFEWNQRLSLDSAMRNVQPGQARDFAETATNQYVESAKTFFKDVPDHLKPQYEAKLFRVERDLYGNATTFARNEQKRFSVNSISETTENIYRPRARITPTENLDEVTADFEGLVRANPDLTPIEQDELIRKGKRAIALSHVDGLPPDQIKAMLGTGAQSIADRIIGVESGGRVGAKNPNSTASGLGQFIDSTWLEQVKKHRPDVAQGKTDQEILAMRTDKQFAWLGKAMVANYARENAGTLEAAGVEARPGNVYLAHFLGPKGAVQLLTADPSAPVEKVLPASFIAANGKILAGKTAGEVAAWAARKMGEVRPEALSALTDADWKAAETAAITKQARVATEQSEAYERQFIDAGIGKAVLPERAVIEADPLLDELRRNTLLKAYDKTAATVNAVANMRLRMADPIAVFDPTDKADKNTFDALFHANGGPDALQNLNADFVSKQLIPDIKRVGFIPKTAKGVLLGLLRASEHNKVTFALSTMDALERVNPDAFERDMGRQASSMLNTYRENLQFRTGPEIVELIRRSEDPAEMAARKELTKDGREKAADISDGTILDAFDPGIFAIGPDEPADPLMTGAMRHNFNELYAEEYARSKNQDAAQEAAFRRLKTMYGGTVASTDGTSRLLYRPPEKYYPTVDSSHAWLTAQIKEDAKPYLQPSDRFATIAPDRRTEEQIASGAAPTYRLIAIDETGAPRAVMDNGRPVRIQFDVKKAMAGKPALFESARNRTLASEEYRDVDESRAPYGVPSAAGAQ